MADELTNVQAQQGVNPLWPTTGVVVGGAGTAYGLNRAGYLTSPYKSVEDLIAEKEDTFNGKKVNSEGQAKALETAQKAFNDAGAKYDADLKAYIEANSSATQETPEFKKLVAKQEEFAEKVKGLEAAASETTATTKPVVRQPISVVRENANRLYKASEELQALKEAGASKEAIAAAQARVDKASEGLNKAIEKIVKATAITGTEAEKAVAEKALKNELEGYAQLYMHERDKFKAIKPDRAFLDAKEAIARNDKTIENSLAKIKKTTGFDLTESLKDSKKFDNKIDTLLKIEENKTSVLEKLLKDYAETPAVKKPGVWTRIATAMEYIASGEIMPTTPENIEIAEFIKNIKDSNYKEAVEKLLSGKEVTKEEIEQLLAESKERTKVIANSAHDIRVANIVTDTNKEIIKNLREALVAKYGEGTYINEAGEVCKGKKVIEKPAEFKAPEYKPVAKNAPELPKTVDFGTKEVASAETKELNAAKKQLEQLTKEVETARANLPKVDAKTPEQLTAEFVEKNGNKRKALEDALKKCENDLKPLFEKKWGTGKITGAIAGGAAVAGLLAYMIAPKRS